MRRPCFFKVMLSVLGWIGGIAVPVLLTGFAACNDLSSVEDILKAQRKAHDQVSSNETSALPDSQPDVLVAGRDLRGLPDGERGAKALLERFLAPEADVQTLTYAIKPSEEDYRAVFKGNLAEKAKSMYGPVWDHRMFLVTPKPGQTELLIWGATPEELSSGDGQAQPFSTQWSALAPHLREELTFYKFKFVEPGQKLGMAYDGLVHVNGHWTIFPKAFRALE